MNEESPIIFYTKTDTSKLHLAEVMPWVLSQDSFKTIARPQIHCSTDGPNMNIFDKRMQDVFGVKYTAMILLIEGFFGSFTACDDHHTGLAESFW